MKSSLAIHRRVTFYEKVSVKHFSFVTVNLLSFASGAMLGWSSPVLVKLKSTQGNPLPEPLTPDQESWIGSLVSLGALFGPFPCGYISAKFGRKPALVTSAAFLSSASMMLAFAASIPEFYAARLMAGLSIGGILATVPLYVAEISEVTIRGILDSTMNNSLTLGLLVSYVIGPYLSIRWFSVTCAVAPTVFICTFLPLMCDTPYYCVSKSDFDAGAKLLARYRSKGVKDVQDELGTIVEYVEKSRVPTGSVTEILASTTTRKSFVIALLLMTFEQLSGINVVLIYSQIIFEESGSHFPSEIPPMIIGAVAFVSSFITPSLVDNRGRKVLLLFSGAGMMLALVPLGVYFYLKQEGKYVGSLTWFPVVCLVFFVIVYNSGFGPLPWTIMAEVYPTNIKPVAVPVTAFVSGSMGFAGIHFFVIVSNTIGMSGSFWIFAGFNLLAVIFIHKCVPETKGKTFQEIQEILKS